VAPVAAAEGASYRPAAIGTIKRCFTNRTGEQYPPNAGPSASSPGSLQEPGERGAAHRRWDVVRMSAIGEHPHPTASLIGTIQIEGVTPPAEAVANVGASCVIPDHPPLDARAGTLNER
jgi:hypothetical protein